MKRLLSTLTVAALVFALVACGSSQDRRDSFYAKAQQLAAEGKHQDAQVELKNAIKIDPKFAKGYTLLGKEQLQDRNWPGAFGSFQRAAELDPEDIEAHLGLCKLYLLSRSIDKAEQKADLILSKQPAHVEAGVIKSIALTKKNRIPEALATLEKLQQANPDNADVFIARSEAHAAQKDMAAAEAVLLQGLAKNPQHLLLNLQLANHYMQLKRYDEAEKRFTDIVNLDPNNASGNMLLVDFYFRSGQQDKATQALSVLAQRFPKEGSFRVTQANSAMAAGKPAEAEAVLVRGLQDIPDSKDIRVALAEHYLRTGQFAKVEPLVQEMIQKEPEHPQTVAARRLLANAFVASQQPDKARVQLDALFKRNPRDTEGHLISGALNLQAGKVREAIVELREVADADPKNMKALELLVRAHMVNKEPALAEALLGKHVADYPENSQARLLLVEVLLQTGKTDRALGELNALSGADQKNPAIFNTVGDIYAQKQNLGAAKAAYQRAVAVAPKDPAGHIKLGRILWASRDARGAHAAFDQALALAPDARDAVEAKVSLFMQEKRAQDALAFARQRVAAQPNDAFGYALLGRVMMESGDLPGAEQQLLKSVQLAPDVAAPYQYLGTLYIRQGKLDAGLGKFREAYAANPGNAAAGLALATLLQTNNNRAEAISTYEKILAKNPDFAPAVNNLAYLYADEHATPAELQKAQVLAERLKAVDAPVTFDTIGWVQLKLGNKEEALRYLLRAWDKANGMPTVAYHLGMAYQAKGDASSAAKWMEKSLAGNAQFPERAAATAELARLRGKK